MQQLFLVRFLRIHPVQSVINNPTQLSGRGFPHFFYIKLFLSQFNVLWVLPNGRWAEQKVVLEQHSITLYPKACFGGTLHHFWLQMLVLEQHSITFCYFQVLRRRPSPAGSGSRFHSSPFPRTELCWIRILFLGCWIFFWICPNGGQTGFSTIEQSGDVRMTFPSRGSAGKDPQGTGGGTRARLPRGRGWWGAQRSPPARPQGGAPPNRAQTAGPTSGQTPQPALRADGPIGAPHS